MSRHVVATAQEIPEGGRKLVTVRGATRVVVTEHRPVPLWQHMLVGRRMFDLFHDQEAAKAQPTAEPPQWFEKVSASGAPQAPAAQARLKDL